MYQIALCDDEVEELDKSESILKSYREQHTVYDFSIERFEDVNELLRMVREKEYVPDLLFMDIYMPDKQGIEAAKELREMGSKLRLVFLTTSMDHALDAFRVEASQYLVKPIHKKKMFPLLDKLLGEIEKEQKKYIPFRIENKIYRIALSDIVFCEAQKKCQCIYLSDGEEYLVRMTMAKICEMLSEYPEFVKVGISYIVNLEHVESLSTRELQMDNERKVYLPRGSYQTFRERYFDYYFEDFEQE